MRTTFVLALSLYPLIASAQEFHGYPCTVDCSGHAAGYEWATQNDIDDEFGCNGNSNSFNEGCRAYVEEREEEKALSGDPVED